MLGNDLRERDIRGNKAMGDFDGQNKVLALNTVDVLRVRAGDL